MEFGNPISCRSITVPAQSYIFYVCIINYSKIPKTFVNPIHVWSPQLAHGLLQLHSIFCKCPFRMSLALRVKLYTWDAKCEKKVSKIDGILNFIYLCRLTLHLDNNDLIYNTSGIFIYIYSTWFVKSTPYVYTCHVFRCICTQTSDLGGQFDYYYFHPRNVCGDMYAPHRGVATLRRLLCHRIMIMCAPP